MSDLFTTLSIFYLIIFCGFIFGRIFKKHNQQIRKTISSILLFIITPPLIFFAFFLSEISLNILIVLNIIIFQIILVFTSQFITYFIFLRKRKNDQKKRSGAILNLVAFPNAMIFPLPIVLSLFGTDYVIILVIFSLIAMILRSTWATYLNIYFGAKKEQTVKENFKKMIAFPPTLTLIACVILKGFNLTFNEEILAIIRDCISYSGTLLGAILIGVLIVNINFNKVKSFKKDFFIVLIIRLGFSFFLFLFLGLFLTFPPDMSKITLTILLLLYIDPPAITNTTYAEYFELDKEFSAFCVITITILAIFYIPLIIMLGMILF